VKEKVRILVKMQEIFLPLLARLRPLCPHERPWPIEP